MPIPLIWSFVMDTPLKPHLGSFTPSGTDAWHHPLDETITSRRREPFLVPRLVNYTKPTEPGFQLHFHKGASLMRLKAVGGPRRGGGRRCQASKFTLRSRMNLIQKLGAVDVGKVARCRSVVTLTYPKVFPACPRTWKKHLDIFLKRLRRAYTFQAVVWKLEPQRRGAPHFQEKQRNPGPEP